MPSHALYVHVCVQELPVYRCALMCAQFPMLSAPSPPDGQSPTPPPPSLPSVFTTATLQYSQTAPTGQYLDEVSRRHAHCFSLLQA